MKLQTNALKEQGYLVIKQAVPKETCTLLADYALFKSNLKPNIHHNDPIASTHREYGDALMEMLLEKLTPTIEQATELSLWPTLSFYYTYKNGSKLSPHRDRSSCQVVASLYIGADPEFSEMQQSWPLIIKANGTTTPVSLEKGDLLVFRGYETEHWREIFTGSWYVSAIFAFVEQDGPYAFQKFDQRKQLGMPHVGMFRWMAGCLKASILAKIQRKRINV